MRPTPQEIIDSARALLREQVGPDAGPEAQVTLRRVMSALRDARWNEAAFDLLRENERLAALVRDAVADAACMQRSTIRDALQAATDLHAARGTPRSFAEANEINQALRRALTQLIEAMRQAPLAGDERLGNRIAAVMLSLQESST